MRIERTKTLLAETNLPIKHIAQQAGFQTHPSKNLICRQIRGHSCGWSSRFSVPGRPSRPANETRESVNSNEIDTFTAVAW